MGLISLQEHLGNIVGKAGKDKESVDIRLAIERFPSLLGYRHPVTNELLLVSNEINPYCTDVFIETVEDEVRAIPYTTDKAVRLHSNPIVFFVGYHNDRGFGIVPYPGWEEHFTGHNLGRDIIRKVRNYLAQHRPVDYPDEPSKAD